jgi:hypothetical protein
MPRREHHRSFADQTLRYIGIAQKQRQFDTSGRSQLQSRHFPLLFPHRKPRGGPKEKILGRRIDGLFRFDVVARVRAGAGPNGARRRPDVRKTSPRDRHAVELVKAALQR